MKKGLSAKGWIVSFIAMLLLIMVLWASLNVLVDPFGAFGTENDFTWWSYEATLNPRVAKISYLEKHHDEYDSYVLGCSSCSSWPVEELEKYTGGKYYNLINYGMDAVEMQQLAEYIIENYTVKNLFVSVYVGSAETTGEFEQTLTYSNHYKVNHSSALGFYTKYLFADPSNAIKKLQLSKTDGIIPAAHDCFNAQTGAYDKRWRDIEPIGSIKEYVAKPAYNIFTHYPTYHVDIPYIDEIAQAVAAITKLCGEKGINLTVASVPVYSGNLAMYSKEDVDYFEKVLTEAAGDLYHSYTICNGCDDPRFFYDEFHFRNALGVACLENLYEGKEVAVTEELRLPVLMYHSFVEDGNEFSISPSVFEEHLQALTDAGYTTVSFSELEDYVNRRVLLPEKSVLITIDDGYENNYTEAYPLLQKYNAKATIFTIGKSIGKDVYTDGKSMTPHFSEAQAKEMISSGLVEIGIHTYNMHQVNGRDPEPVRHGASQLEGESDAEYIQALTEDIAHFSDPMFSRILSYPEGQFSNLSDFVFAHSGIYATCTSEVKINTVVQGMPQSLYHLGRIDADSMTAQELLRWIEK